jgi:hypothetical protein
VGRLCRHDFKGDDLRRGWDDPLLDKEGTHPVVYAAAESPPHPSDLAAWRGMW